MKQYSFASVNLIIDGVKVNGLENSQKTLLLLVDKVLNT